MRSAEPGVHSAAFLMHILYLDDAGSPKNAAERHFVLAGVSVFERQTFYLETELDKLAATLDHPEPKKLEFHGNQILAGRGYWRKFPQSRRRTVLLDALACVRRLYGQWALFGVVVDKAAVSPEDPVEYAFEEIASRFDKTLRRMHLDGNSQRGLIVFDKSTMETRIQALTTEFRFSGHRNGKLHNLADVPFFVDSAASRLVQFADLVSYALWRRYEKDDSEFYDVIDGMFAAEGGVTHGLLVKRQD